jgi:hypothetical protein
MAKRPGLRNVLGQPSWRIATPRVEAFVTETGGHLGPVIFDRRGKKIAPLSVAPWAEEDLDRSTPAIIRVLRGDFFCMPFGGNESAYRGERHPVHGETANAKWKFESLDEDDAGCVRLHLALRTKIRPGRVDKYISTPADHDAIYQRHVVSETSGPMNFGHHAMIKFPNEPESGVVSTSRFVHGQVFVRPTELPANRGYSILKPAEEFESLERVPTTTGETTDLSRYPARRGFEDIVMLVSDASAPFAWTAVTFPRQRYVWFALKDPRVLQSTIFWISNGGRHYPPWNGRHVNVMGLEEVTSYFHLGLAESVKPNPLSQRGIQTSAYLKPSEPLTVNYIFGVVAIPPKFDRIASIEPASDGIELRSSSGAIARTPIDLKFLTSAG